MEAMRYHCTSLGLARNNADLKKHRWRAAHYMLAAIVKVRVAPLIDNSIVAVIISSYLPIPVVPERLPKMRRV
jgi:hypothetical protein